MKPYLLPMILPFLLPVLGACTGLSPEQRQMLDRSLEEYRARQYQPAEAELNRFLAEVKTGPEVADALYVRGLIRVQTDRPGEARSDFEQAFGYKPSPLLAAKLEVALGNLDTSAERPQEAITHYAAALYNLPIGPPTDQVLYWMGVNQQILGQWMEAGLSFSRLLEEYRTSPLAEKARGRLRYHAFTVCLGAYSDLSAAHRRADELREKKLDVLVTGGVQADGLPMAMVQMGSYRTLAEAKTALAEVQKNEPQAEIVP